MCDYKTIYTSKEVFRALCAEHKDLKVFSSYSAPNGDEFSDPSECVMMTEYGIDGFDIPLVGAKTTWDKNNERPHERLNEKHVYWLCIPVCSNA